MPTCSRPLAAVASNSCAAAVSRGVTANEMLTSVITLTAIYGVLAVVEIFLMVRYVRGGIAGVMPPEPPDKKDSDDEALSFAY